MKSSRLLIPLCLLVAAILYFSCNKTDTPDTGHLPEYVTATLAGRVTDDAKMPVSGAVVKAGSASATTDVNGTFIISNVNIDRKAALVKVEKEGYFLGAKTLVASANKDNQVIIQLIKKTIAGTITGAGGGTVTVPSNGGSIAFETNSIINPTGNTAYTGTVAVSAFFINPEAPDFRDIMPGALRGITTNNQETGLQSFGMMAVELTGEAGEKLQLAPGKLATLHFPIPATLQNEAPATIPLWSLDETTGLWKEEGSATRQGTEYVGEVSHFSFWNCDAPFPVVNFTATIRNQQGHNMDGAEVVITASAGGNSAGIVSANGYTNTEGIIHGMVPANKTLQLKIYDKCHTLLHTQSFGPFTGTANLGVITVNSQATQVSISGTVKDCSNSALPNGFVSVELEGNYYNIPVTNGSFNTTLTRCGNSAATAVLTAFDTNNNEYGPAVNITVSGNTAPAGELSACGISLNSYIKYTINGVSYHLAPPADTLQFRRDGNFSAVHGITPNQANEIMLIFYGAEAPGTYQLAWTDVKINNKTYLNQGGNNINITKYGPSSGGYVTGTLSGSLRDSTNNNLIPISCSFQVKR